MKEVETDLQELQSVSDRVAQYFCEDAKNFKLEECCSIFNSFCERFLRAIQVIYALYVLAYSYTEIKEKLKGLNWDFIFSCRKTKLERVQR